MTSIKLAFLPFVFKIFSVLMGFGWAFYINHTFGTSKLGEFTYFFTILQILSIVSRLGIDTVIVKYTSNVIKLQRVYLYTFSKYIIATSFLFGFIMYCVNEYKYSYLIAILLIPLNLTYLFSEYFRVIGKKNIYAFFNSLSIHFFFLVFLIFVNMYTAFTLSVFVSFLSSLYLVSKALDTDRAGSITQSLKEILTYSLPLFLNISIGILLSWIDVLMLGNLINDHTVGVYMIYLKIASSFTIILYAVNSYMAPKISILLNKKYYSELSQELHKISFLLFLFSCISLMILFIIDDFILSYFGNDFIANKSIMWILAIGFIIKTISGPIGYVINFSIFSKSYLKFNFMFLIISCILNYILIQMYGMIGAAITTVITLVLLSATGYFLYHKLQCENN